VPADALSVGSNVPATITAPRANESFTRIVILPGYLLILEVRLTIALRKGVLSMAMAKALGVVVLVLVALLLIFTLVGVLTAIIKFILVVLIVIAICYGVYHLFKKH